MPSIHPCLLNLLFIGYLARGLVVEKLLISTGHTRPATLATILTAHSFNTRVIDKSCIRYLIVLVFSYTALLATHRLKHFSVLRGLGVVLDFSEIELSFK